MLRNTSELNTLKSRGFFSALPCTDPTHLPAYEMFSFPQKKQGLALISSPQRSESVSRKTLPHVRGTQVHMGIIKLSQEVKIRTNGHVDTKSERIETKGSLL